VRVLEAVERSLTKSTQDRYFCARVREVATTGRPTPGRPSRFWPTTVRYQLEQWLSKRRGRHTKRAERRELEEWEANSTLRDRARHIRELQEANRRLRERVRVVEAAARDALSALARVVGRD
jgi:ferric-dicitrate binding protein FerR (iron transport regulator)